MTTIEKTLRYVALGCVFALPFVALIVAESLFFPFITGKNFAFRVLVEIAASAWLALALVRAEYRPKRSWLLAAFAAFVLIMAVADAFGVYPWKSFWSNFERMDGWVTLAHLLVYFVVATSLLSTERLWRAWWNTSLGVSVLMSVYGLLQLAGLFIINQGGDRLDARLGNATYLGIYMLFHVFIAAFLLARMWVEWPKRRVSYTLLYGSIIALDSFILFFTATRGAILGLVLGALLTAFLLVILSPNSRVAWRAGVAVLALLLLGGGFWMARGFFKESRIEPVRRVATMSFSEGTIASRFMNVGMAWEGVKERPILGWGQENYAAVFDKHYNPDMWAQEPWFDRVHNVIFDWFVAGGILGLLGYLSLWAAGVFALWRSGAFAPYERAILSGLLAGYFFYNIFTFDNITSYILFVSLLAWIAVRAGRDALPVFSGSLPRAALPILAVCAVLLAWGSAWGVNARALAVNRDIIQGLSVQSSPEKNLEYFSDALKEPSVGTQEAREHLMQAAMAVRGREDISQELKLRFAERAAEGLKQQMEDAPYNARAPLFLGILLDGYGASSEAALAFAEARARSPHKQSILFASGQNAFARGKEDEALDYFKEAYELAPTYPEARALHIVAAISVGNDELARSLIEPAIAGEAPLDDRIAAAWAAKGQYGTIAALWKRRVEAQPEDAKARLALAIAYYGIGEKDAAIRELEAAKDISPALTNDVNTLIVRMRAGTLQLQ